MNRNRPGQTLLELVIAMGVILTSVTAATTLIISTITAGRLGQSNVEAANFAREGIEIVRSIRDSNLLKAERNVINTSTGLVTEWDNWPGTNQSLGASAPKCFAAESFSTATGWVLRGIVSATLCSTPALIWDRTLSNYHAQPITCAPPGQLDCRATRYSRHIRIERETECISNCAAPTTDDVNVERLHVVSTVVWKDRVGPGTPYIGFNRSLVAEAYLYKWR
jgi:type II secretory pathway pseudopilin PulG